MLPEIRTSGDIYSIPEFDLDRNDVEGFLDILKGFHAEFRDCFAREEGRNNFLYYTNGQFSQMERKSIEPMALNVEGAKVRAIQRFISEATWDDEKMMDIYRCMVNDDMGEENGVPIIDESGFSLHTLLLRGMRYWTKNCLFRRYGLQRNMKRGEINANFLWVSVLKPNPNLLPGWLMISSDRILFR